MASVYKKNCTVSFLLLLHGNYQMMQQWCLGRVCYVLTLILEWYFLFIRVLVLFKDGVTSLWDIQESKVVYSTGRNSQISSHQEPKWAVTACWACPFGSKLVVGYSNGEIFIWAIPTLSDQRNASSNKKELHATPNLPLFRLNLGYKTDKVPIVSLKWVIGDGRSSRLYVNGYSDLGSYSFQVQASCPHIFNCFLFDILLLWRHLLIFSFMVYQKHD